jgi:hypothetical protein
MPLPTGENPELPEADSLRVVQGFMTGGVGTNILQIKILALATKGPPKSFGGIK